MGNKSIKPKYKPIEKIESIKPIKPKYKLSQSSQSSQSSTSGILNLEKWSPGSSQLTDSDSG